MCFCNTDKFRYDIISLIYWALGDLNKILDNFQANFINAWI